MHDYRVTLDIRCLYYVLKVYCVLNVLMSFAAIEVRYRFISDYKLSTHSFMTY